MTKYRIILLFFISAISVPQLSAQNKISIHNKSAEELKKLLPSLEQMCSFPRSTEWVNAEKTKYPENEIFEGRIKVIHFNSLDNIQSQKNLNELQKLSAYFQNVKLIAVNSPKFDYPRSADQLKLEIIRNEWSIPFINDTAYDLRQCYNVKSMPSTFIIAPGGEILERIEGEISFIELKPVLESLQLSFKNIGKLKTTPLVPISGHHNANVPLLGKPSGIAIDEHNRFIYVSDALNNRIVSFTPNGEIMKSIGTGKNGNQDGERRFAEFSNPTGLAFNPDSNILYVSDSHNNVIRAVNLNSDSVKTILGNGEIADKETVKVIGTNAGLNNPQGLLYHDSFLYIAMAGKGEIWRMDLRTNVAEKIAGNSGQETEATVQAISQPMDIAMDASGALIFTDSQSSAILELFENKISVIAGGDIDSYGDEDGRKEGIKLQYPTGICYYNGDFYFTDTYNHKIKKINIKKQKAETIAGSGAAEFANGFGENASFYLPVAIAALNDNLYICDAMNGLIRVLEISSGEVSTISFKNMKEIAQGSQKPIFKLLEGETVILGPDSNTIHYSLELGEKYEIDPSGMNTVSISSRNNNFDISSTNLDNGALTIGYNPDDNDTELYYNLDFYLFIREKELPEKQYFRSFSVLNPADFSADAPLEHTIIFSPEL